MINKVLLIGRLTKNPEVRYLPSGMQITSFTLAVKRNFKDKNGNWQEETYFFDIETFGNLAERLGNSLNKGYQVYLEGSLRQDKWETNTGEKRSKVKIVAEKVSVLSKPSNNQSQETDSFDEEPLKADLESDEDVPF
ncbi:MAG: single-stranded DNA-binding protein [Hydrogenothermaceae bacterium]